MDILFMFLFIIIILIAIIMFVIYPLIPQNRNYQYTDLDWDANKAREESEIGLKRETENEINRIYNIIKINSERLG